MRRTPGPSVVAIIPARDEADMIANSVGSLLRQDYPGRFSVVVVDDQSSDGTAAAASAAASAAGAADRLSIVAGSSPPPGWTGKLWAMRQGLAAVDAGATAPEFVLFSDADIAYAPHVLGRLVAIARAEKQRPHVADGEAALRERGRALARAGLRVLLPDALSLRLGERSAAGARPRRPAAACWRGARPSPRRAASRRCAAP